MVRKRKLDLDKYKQNLEEKRAEIADTIKRLERGEQWSRPTQPRGSPTGLRGRRRRGSSGYDTQSECSDDWQFARYARHYRRSSEDH